MSDQDFTFDQLFASRRVLRVRLGDGTCVVHELPVDEVIAADAALRNNVPRLARRLGVRTEGRSHGQICQAIVRWYKKNHQHRPKAPKVRPTRRARGAGG